MRHRRGAVAAVDMVEPQCGEGEDEPAAVEEDAGNDDKSTRNGADCRAVNEFTQLVSGTGWIASLP